MEYDIAIIWWWAWWLFSSINIPKKFKKIILEKNTKPWIKVLLSWWERANVSNINIDIENDYFWQNKKALKSIFSKFNQYDIINFFVDNKIDIIEEDRWRLILKSWDSKELLDLLIKKSSNNNTIIKTNFNVQKITKFDEYFEIQNENEIIKAKYIIISSWWKSFSHVWTTWDWYKFAKDFDIEVIALHKWLCWLSTKKDLSSLSWSSINTSIEIIDINKTIYSEFWPLLFTHFWLSWPIIYNSSIAIGEYLNKIKICSEEEKINYLKENIFIKINLKKDECTKKIYSFFKDYIENEKQILIWLQDWTSRKEAKITWWWIKIDELDNFLQSKKHERLFFNWEIIDITWKTWWYNLQWAWSSAYVNSLYFKNFYWNI